MGKIATKRSGSSRPSKFPIQCKTWAEVEELKKKYLKPAAFGPKGQPIYDLEEVAKYIIFPQS